MTETEAPLVASQMADAPQLSNEISSSRHRTNQHHPTSGRRKSTFRRVRYTALAGKRKIWDSNDASINAALTAVDHWEAAYNALRGVLVTSVQSAQSMYGAAKAGATRIEHHLLVPVRDYVILPAFSGVERAAVETSSFLQSEQAAQLAGASLNIVKKTPYLGESIIAPALVGSVDFIKTAWHVAQYPIPSRAAVRSTVDWTMTGTKWALRTVAREVYFYAKFVDATITRTLMHTQWRVLGSGPYATLDTVHKREVIDHLCERYFSLSADPIARYELAAHIRAHNRQLYNDLVVTGLLLERGGEMTEDDTWLSSCPSYRMAESPFLLPRPGEEYSVDEIVDGMVRSKDDEEVVVPLWFRLPYQNGKKPVRDAPWVCFGTKERRELERGYLIFLKSAEEAGIAINDGKVFGPAPVIEEDATGEEMESDDSDDESSPVFELDESLEVEESHPPKESSEGDGDTDVSSGTEDEDKSTIDGDSYGSNEPEKARANSVSKMYPTVAKWYEPDLMNDVLVDQKRHAVSYLPHCPICRTQLAASEPPLLSVKQRFRKPCERCLPDSQLPLDAFSPPPVSMLMRPTLWRFHGPGDEVRRAVWLLDTNRNGLQPYCDEAAAVLEDAYLFLKWNALGKKSTVKNIDGVLLTVQVPSPEGDEQQLVQFRSLTQVTAVQKTLGGALAVFKRRVYRGVCVPNKRFRSDNMKGVSSSDQSETDAVELSHSTLPTADDALASFDCSRETSWEKSLDDTKLVTSTESENDVSTIRKADISESSQCYKDDVSKQALCATEGINSMESTGNGSTQSNVALAQDSKCSDDDVLKQKLNAPEQKKSTETVVNGSILPNAVATDNSVCDKDALSKQPFDDTEKRTLNESASEEEAEEISDSATALAAPLSLLNSRTPLDCEDDQDDIDHLVLVVHGIGEMLHSVDLFGMGLPALSSIIDCCGWLRKNHAEVHAAQLSDLDRSDSGTKEKNSISGRVEYIPVEWHEAFALQSQRRPVASTDPDMPLSSKHARVPSQPTLIDISLPTIPHLRAFANDTMLDILYFMSPKHHDIIVDIVSTEMNVVYEKFRRLTGFNGKVSLIAHSLGSVIAWDILAHQKQESTSLRAHVEREVHRRRWSGSPSGWCVSPERASPLDALCAAEKGNSECNQPLISASYPQLPFEVVNVFMLGSPVAVFLMIRNQEKPLNEDFFLPGCRRVFNIFHPYDPAAYRIEPLIDRRNAAAEAKIITYWKGGFRVQYQTKFLWKKLVEKTRKTQRHVIEVVEAGMAGIGLLDATVDDLMEEEEDDNVSEMSFSDSDENNLRLVRCGRLNQGRRIDYMLQEKEIENANEYVFALAAHSSYWNEKDLSLFVARQIFRSRNETPDEGAVTGPVQGVVAKSKSALAQRKDPFHVKAFSSTSF